MGFRYQPYKIVTEDMPIEQANENRLFNNQILREGVSKTCLETRPPTRGERLDYEHYAPWGTMLTWVEVYSNGAKNFFVREKLSGSVVGIISVRPIEPYNAEKEYKPLTK